MSKKMGIILGFILLSSTLSFITPTWYAWAEERYSDLQNFAKVLNLIQQFYVEEVDTKKLVYGGIKGMLRELDPHTNFLPPEIYKEFENETNGEFGGLGIEISVEKGLLTIISPIEDTPAWKAGLKPADVIVEIDGTSTKGLSLVEAAQKMRGPKGSDVKLGVLRQGQDKPLQIVVTRGTVKLKSVKYINFEDGFAYIRVTSFIESTAKDMQKFLENHEKENKGIKGLILDLRRNPGGLLDQAVKVSDFFLESGTIVSTIGRNKKEKEVVYAKKDGQWGDFPVIVLINESSASASEIVAGALQDNHRALIMGKRSFGKGSVQSVVKLGDGSGLKMTVARYYTPSGVSIQSQGIKPDIDLEDFDVQALEKAVVQSKATREKDIEGHLLGEAEKDDDSSSSLLTYAKGLAKKEKSQLSDKEKLLSSDYQALQAFNYLKAWKVMKGIEKQEVKQEVKQETK